jgi:hypothetical protein
MEDGPPLVAKFYRPLRWTDEQILEEHAFSQELADEEVPVVPAMRLDNGATLHRHAGFRFAVFRRHGGRAPELDDADTLERLGRFIGRIHAVGLRSPFQSRPALDIASFGEEPRDWLLANDFIPMDVATAWRTTVEQALEGVRRCYERAGRSAPCACMAIAMSATSCGPMPARTSSISTTAAAARPYRTCGCCSRANGARWWGNWPTCWQDMKVSANSSRASCTSSKPCARCA